jgi:two-component system chemotaxis sensor kinase CheA
MDRRSSWSILEEIASAIVIAEASDHECLVSLVGLFGELKRSFAEAGETKWKARAAKLGAEAKKLLKEEGDETSEKLDQLSKKVAELQRAIRTLFPKIATPTTQQSHSEQRTGCANEREEYVRPVWVDPEVLRDFLAHQTHELDEIESDILALEDGGTEPSNLKARIHNLKGEAGVLGADDLADVCHALEDALDAAQNSRALTDLLLYVKDWMADAFQAYAERRLPEPRSEAVVALLQASTQDSHQEPSKSDQNRSVGEAHKDGSSSIDRAQLPGEAVAQDEDTVEAFGDFLDESDENLDRADEILIRIERQGSDPDSIHDLFRVFHTVKGMAGFLGVSDVADLAHASEALLNRARDNRIELTGYALELLFDTTRILRGSLHTARVALESNREIPLHPEVGPILARLRVFVSRYTDSVPTLSDSSEVHARVLSGHTSSGEPIETVTRNEEREPRIKESVKVYVERLDRLVEMIGELVIVESMVANAPEITSLSSRRVRSYVGQLERIATELQDVGLRMRMVPVRGLFQKMLRMVRDLSRKSHKQVRLTISGGSTEIDRNIVEQIADPLMHMIRNSVSHGIESPEERIAVGKPTEGTIRLSAKPEGGSIVIQVTDDGHGLDRDLILRRARDLGLVEADSSLSDSDILKLIFQPGFSTAAEVNEVSGRGVGMDVVRKNINALRGRIAVSSNLGEGTSFRVILPLTLAIIDGMLVSCGRERYIIPTMNIVESIQVNEQMLASLVGRSELVSLRGKTIPLLRLSRLFDVEDAVADATEGLVVVLEGVGRRVALLVDEVITQQQVVIKSLGAGIGSARLISGAAIMSDGRVGLILNTEEITALAGGTDGNLECGVAQRPKSDPRNVAVPTPIANNSRSAVLKAGNEEGRP